MKNEAANLNLNETALLGLLSEKARYGYELDKIIEDRLMREWTDIAFSSIYAILKGLEDKGCVESSSQIAGNRVRRHYAITRRGRKILKKSTVALLSEPSKAPDPLMAGLANSGLLNEEAVQEALAARAAALRKQLSLIEKGKTVKHGKDRAYFEALTARAAGSVAEELRFVETFIEKPTPRTEPPAAQADTSAPQPKPAVPSTKSAEKVEPPAPQKKESEEKGSEEQKQTLF